MKAPTPAPERAPSEASDYDLNVDAQVEKFVEIKQKLTYFLITASVAVTAFVVSFVVDNLRVDGRFTTTTLEARLVVFSALAGLVTAGLSLLNIRFEHRSYLLHLGYRYKRMTWESLEQKEKQRWDRINDWAARFLAGAFAFLFFEIGLAVVFFIVVFW